ncbi:MAG: hypothetical protein PWP27_1051 [Clostridiales bacterium]|jgi:hypothetical protein|nr:hypothetical protein [Clostridiales bacterium]
MAFPMRLVKGLVIGINLKLKKVNGGKMYEKKNFVFYFDSGDVGVLYG